MTKYYTLPCFTNSFDETNIFSVQIEGGLKLGMKKMRHTICPHRHGMIELNDANWHHMYNILELLNIEGGLMNNTQHDCVKKYQIVDLVPQRRQGYHVCVDFSKGVFPPRCRMKDIDTSSGLTGGCLCALSREYYISCVDWCPCGRCRGVS